MHAICKMININVFNVCTERKTFFFSKYTSKVTVVKLKKENYSNDDTVTCGVIAILISMQNHQVS